jgi:Ni/Co efflux regulator RcnB
MKKLITLCTVLALCACTCVNAQTAREQKQQQTAAPATNATLSGQAAATATKPARDEQARTEKPVEIKKLPEHFPSYNDPDFATKLTDWIKNYPAEYQEYMGISFKPAEAPKAKVISEPTEGEKLNKQNNAAGQKSGEHAPDPSDPDYAAKKAEWIKNYPEEYENQNKIVQPADR